MHKIVQNRLAYSECKACKGSKRAALIAGITPEMMPISKKRMKAVAI
ncbi:MAG: hypothetical protein PHD39_09250 [Methylobacter tundripaludum]|nr:hypothetical protein [Methylobacter tundripaludum]